MGRKRIAVGDAGSEDVAYCMEGNPLLMALYQNDLVGARKLIEASDADLETSDQFGWRPLHRAAFAGSPEIVELLVCRRVAIDVLDRDGLQPLHIAAAGGHVECCKVLLRAGACQTQPDCNGLTAGHHALLRTGEVGEAMRELFGVELGEEGSDLCCEHDYCDPLKNPEPLSATEAKSAAELPFAQLLELNPIFAAWLRSTEFLEVYAEAWKASPSEFLAQVQYGGFQIRLAPPRSQATR